MTEHNPSQESEPINQAVLHNRKTRTFFDALPVSLTDQIMGVAGSENSINEIWSNENIGNLIESGEMDKLRVRMFNNRTKEMLGRIREQFSTHLKTTSHLTPSGIEFIADQYRLMQRVGSSVNSYSEIEDALGISSSAESIRTGGVHDINEVFEIESLLYFKEVKLEERTERVRSKLFPSEKIDGSKIHSQDTNQEPESSVGKLSLTKWGEELAQKYPGFQP